jgi:tetratricopeptide (TPR) repeat protein
MTIDYSKICFVIMPFGEKDVTDDKGVTRKVDFDPIYRNVFEPAIGKVELPEGGRLVARRTDEDFFAGDISQEMFEYLEYSRFALTDITGLNPNVFYELGIRHRAREAGTAIFRQLAARIPFDINQIKAFPYQYEPAEQIPKSQEMITRVLRESLQYNRIDSPVRRALIVQREHHGDVEQDLLEAENALRVRDRARAIAAYRKVVAAAPRHIVAIQKLGLLLRDEGKWSDALKAFEKAIAADPAYAEAHREKGIAQNKLYHQAGKPAGEPNGIEALRRAIELNHDDYDAHASLGGILKHEGQNEEALAAYEKAVEISRGHSYPLLNAIKLRAVITGKLAIDEKTRFQLERAEPRLRAQVATDPPYDPPWSFFDLAEVRLYAGDRDGFLANLKKGLTYAGHRWQAETFRKSLQQLVGAGIDLPGLKDGIAEVQKTEAMLD